MLDKVDIDPQGIVLAIIGGALIAFATTVHLMLFGRLTGMSSIFNTLVKCDPQSGFRWKFGFFCGLITGTYGIFMIFGHSINAANVTVQLFDKQEEAQKGLNIAGFALGGLLVGFGTKLGNGCTSGHGICGLPRFSARSWLAVPVFMITGMTTATLRAMFPVFSSSLNMGKEAVEQYKIIADFLFALLLIYFAYDLNVNSAQLRDKLETIACLLIGFVFGLGLTISGMCRRTQILSFLTLTVTEVGGHLRGWNPTLMIVVLTAVLINSVTFNLVLRQKPMFAEKFDIVSGKVDWRVVVGPAVFGIGWGLTGFCPGPAMVNGFFLMQMLAYLPFMAAGQLTAEWLFPAKKVAATETVEKDKKE